MNDQNSNSVTLSVCPVYFYCLNKNNNGKVRTWWILNKCNQSHYELHIKENKQINLSNYTNSHTNFGAMYNAAVDGQCIQKSSPSEHSTTAQLNI